MTPFADRPTAGRALALQLQKFRGDPNVIILALPRGGVPVAFEVAQALGAPLDVLIVRKIGAPYNEEVAIGAIASGGTLVLDDETIRMLRVPTETLMKTVDRERAELLRREYAYRGDRPYPDLNSRTVLIVDDGMATGITMQAAVEAIRQLGPAKVIAAVPVTSDEACAIAGADECISVIRPYRLLAISEWYRNFLQTTDEEVVQLLQGV